MNDVNEYAPVFKEKSYKATVTEGRQYDSILRVEAVDADCSPQFSQICSYEIVTPDVPFAIDKDGKSEEQAFLTGATVRGRCRRDSDWTRSSSVPSGYCNKAPQAGGSNDKTLTSHGSGGGRPGSRCWPI